jgi:hypothetical protein
MTSLFVRASLEGAALGTAALLQRRYFADSGIRSIRTGSGVQTEFPPSHPFIHSFIHSFIQSVSHSVIHSFIQSFIHSFFLLTFLPSFFPSFLPSLRPSFLYSPALCCSVTLLRLIPMFSHPANKKSVLSYSFSPFLEKLTDANDRIKNLQQSRCDLLPQLPFNYFSR